MVINGGFYIRRENGDNQMRIIECDRCHKRIESKDEVGYVALDWRSVKSGDLAGSNTLDSWDFCDECMKEITDFVQHMRPAAQIPQGFKAVDIKPKATIKKPVPGAALTQEKIDQIKQMARDGKTVKEICDCTGVSDPTVRKYKKEVTNETTEPIAEGDQED